MASAATTSCRQNDHANGKKGETKVLCRYYVHGVCRFGDRCRFSHDFHDKPNLVCTFNKKGTCSYGKECRYDHVRGRRENTSKTQITCQEKPSCSNSGFTNTISTHDESWADAAEFIPGRVYAPRVTSSYSKVVKVSTPEEQRGLEQVDPDADSIEELCPYYMVGDCRYGEECVYLHGIMCDMCGLRILHPTDVSQQSKHQEECLASHEEDMKESFKVAQSCDVSCGICMEVVWEKKEKQERKFGILENCSHAFCLDCIRKWRSAKSFNNTVVKSCPECRVTSSFVTPSETWVEDPEEKKKIIQGYKEHLSKKPCKHFNQGRGKCPFGANCFYLHAYPDGTKQDRTKIPKRARNSEGRWETFDPSTLWDFIEERDEGALFDEDSLELFDLVYLLGANTSLSGDDDSFDRWDWFLGIGDSDDDSEFEL